MTGVGPEFWTSLIEKAATVALAVFAIWMLQREFKRQLQDRDDRLLGEREERDDRLETQRREHREERDQLVQVIEHNTSGWRQATQTMSEIATGVAMLMSTIDRNREDISGIRVLLARRPCIGDAATVEDWKHGPGDEPGGGHPRPAPGSSPRP